MLIKETICALVITETVMTAGFCQPTGFSSSELENGLKYELKPLAGTFVEIEETYGINSALYASVVALESGWGRSKLSETKNNITSFTANGELKEYKTKEDCLWDMARNLSENYLDEEGKYYGGGDKIENVSCYYLIGKPFDEMNKSEKERVKEYSETVNDIFKSIAKNSNDCENICPS